MHHHHPHTTNSAANSATPQSTQPPTQRRRKKRPNYGTRTVEVRRGYSGFGFTISGQQPCRLSCIIPNSPADQAGLRAGDFLISVNGLNVSKLPHETVVQLIGNSFGSIRMQIAEYYYSDSTDEENAAASGIPTLPSLGPSRPRYIYHKTKQQRLRHHLPQRKLQESLLPLPRPSTQQVVKKSTLPVKKTITSTEIVNAAPKRSVSEELKSIVTSPSHATAMANVKAMMVRAPVSAALEYRAIVGYLGTIEMPKQIAHSSKLQTVRSCIRKLRQEKRQPSMVLMIILPDCLKLQSNSGNLLATYPSARLNYVSSSSESENRFFGLVTSAVYSPHLDECDEDEDDVAEPESLRANDVAASGGVDNNVIISNSCHVFVVDTKLCEHQQHLGKAQEFRIECTKDPISSLCLEFPNNSEYVVNLIRSMYTMRIIPQAAAQRSISDDPNLHGNNSGAVVAHSPQPSNHSEVSTTTSNSDSGIGYNNDCSNITDRIVVVDFPHNARVRGQASPGVAQVITRPQNICQQNIDPDEEAPCSSSAAKSNKRLTSIRVITDPKVVYHLSSPGRSLIASRSCDDVLNLIEHDPEEFIDPAAVTQPCYASMDDISLHTASMENDESHKFQPFIGASNTSDVVDSKSVDKNAKQESPKPLKLSIEPYNSLQELPAPAENESSPTKLCSTPDLSRPELDGSNSPFDRGWVQTSLRTPRADKHTINFSLSQEEKQQYPQQQQQPQNSYKSPSISRSASMSNSERGSFKSKLPLKDKSKAVKKGPTAWGTCIENLLCDPAGIKTFAEFLKLEYAAENIYFWTACERFRNLEDMEERQLAALHIYAKHLSNSSREPVNVDSQARGLVERNLVNAQQDLFHPAQKQIFNLMKFDSYQRFLRSDLYKQCLQAEKKGKSLPYSGDKLDDLLKTTNFSESASSKLKKSASNAEEGRPRRSLLPWHRKTRSKSRDQIAQDTKDPPTTVAATKASGMSGNLLKPNAMHGSESSLTSFDAITFGNNLTPNDLNCSLCRIKFPDGATTMVQLKTPETVGQLIERLMEKRSIRYQFFDVSIKGPPIKSVDLKASVQQIAGKEVEIEQRVAFKLDLPTPKVISVKSKPRKQLYEVVRPILQRYNINPEIVEVLMRETQEKVDLTQLVTAVNEQRLQVVYKTKMQKCLQDVPHRKAPTIPKNSIVDGLQSAQTTLDEITNKVFSDLMHVKQNQSTDGVEKPKYDQCSLKSDDCPSETSSFFKIRRDKRDSINAACLRTNKVKKTTMHHTPLTSPDNKNALNKIKSCAKLQLPTKVVERQDDLLEGLKRAQLARLEDQRGTEINFELPEFLKNTDNAHKSTMSPSSASPPSGPNNVTANDSNHLSPTPSCIEKPPQPAPRLSIANKVKSLSSTSPMKIDDDHHDQKSLTEDNDDVFHTPSKGPPPLPPKPKVLPIKPSNWGVNMSASQLGNKMSPNSLLPPSTPVIASPQLTNANVVAVSASNNSSPSARCAYLDQPSSSFV